MTREDAQKVADAMGLAVHKTPQGWYTNAVGLEILDTVEPRREDEKIRNQRTATHGRFQIKAASDPGQK